ncbi:helix-turn-helix domain-containing protein [Streptomyces millisiae]|uniref:Helix-turn-helix transcriptional regulator n=1 Tax=Streptomyces millisiae TaxID=3075542 RepID=A0ABU2LWE8_9ACTN|nr:helix-turn-helix transcriptional regulator [Streptomyces sp. DSM 44918]MDT0321507.1 helix-turn-helix transcriptional regulator [Streptomyces sp. DSM 44918]
MGLRVNPTQRQRRLGLELRKLREASGLTGPEAGAFIGVGRAHMSHIEAGRTHIPEDKLRTLAEVYGCKSHQLVDELVAMTRTTGKGWWTDFKRVVDDRARDLAELESTATSHRCFQLIYIPGLLQTPAYMRALMENAEPDAPASRIDRYVEFRLRRQEVLRREPPPHYHAVIHEAAFHMRHVGREAMREQIEHLVHLAQRPHVEIQLLPFKAPRYPATSGTALVIYESACPELRTVYVEHPVSSMFLTDDDRISQFSHDFDRLSSVALTPLDPADTSPDSSHGLVQHLLYGL